MNDVVKSNLPMMASSEKNVVRGYISDVMSVQSIYSFLFSTNLTARYYSIFNILPKQNEDLFLPCRRFACRPQLRVAH